MAAGARERAGFMAALAAMRRRVATWRTADAIQAKAIAGLAADLFRLEEAAPETLASSPAPWDRLYRFAEQRLSLEGQEAAVALLLEPHGALVDDLAERMAADEAAEFPIDGAMDVATLRALIERRYDWALRYDFEETQANARFWYVSAEKLEPRLGERFEEPGAEREQPLAIARDAQALARAVNVEPAGARVAEFLVRRPEWRHTVRRVQIAARHPYSEIRDNLIDAAMRPIDILRAKLAFFGATAFDPRSDRWLRISLFADAPFPESIGEGECDGARL
jgi:hypothetical protein